MHRGNSPNATDGAKTAAVGHSRCKLGPGNDYGEAKRKAKTSQSRASMHQLNIQLTQQYEKKSARNEEWYSEGWVGRGGQPFIPASKTGYLIPRSFVRGVWIVSAMVVDPVALNRNDVLFCSCSKRPGLELFEIV